MQPLLTKAESTVDQLAELIRTKCTDVLKNALAVYSREALMLPPHERADFAAELLASLDETMESPEDVQAAWGAEIERRARRVLSGESAGESWEDVRNRIARLLTKR